MSSPYPDYAYKQPPPGYAPQQPPPSYASQQPPPSYASQQPPPSYAPQQPLPTYAAPQYPTPGPAANFNSQSHSIQIVNTGPQPQAASVVYATSGSCPNCRAGVFVDDFTCCGICLAVCFFPLGLICCFAMRERKCSNCGLIFG
ncbi:membrane protein BRI3-like [Macrobrachium rosenbergii]|uniref:membrane protein BRI3-like n=1 Tax=Macrobrachium rosenbergii TaxID=79674 RepID=UPI0034D712C8